VFKKCYSEFIFCYATNFVTGIENFFCITRKHISSILILETPFVNLIFINFLPFNLFRQYNREIENITLSQLGILYLAFGELYSSIEILGELSNSIWESI